MMGCSPISSRILRKSSMTSGAKVAYLNFSSMWRNSLSISSRSLYLIAMEEIKIVPVQEFGKNPGVQVPGIRDPDVLFQFGIMFLQEGQEDLIGQNHPGCLSPQLSRAACGSTDTAGE